MVKTETLPNGIRIVTESVPHVQSVSAGIWVASGACDESASTRGISHFMEHMLFKGTETRTARQIADEFDSIGGHVNAFTEKEYTCYYSKVLAEHLPLAVEVLSDMLLNSLLDPREIELERNVVLQEIKRHEDAPEDLVHDVFAQTAWNGHPLGNSVLGDANAVRSLTREDMAEFLQTRYTPDGIIISAAGNLIHDKLVEQVVHFFGDLSGARSAPENSLPCFSCGSTLTEKSTEQVHLCIGTQGYSQLDPDRYAMAVIDATLGGGMSSRLFQEIREKRGLVYAIGSYSAAYREGGLFMVYGGTSVENMEEVLSLVKAEFAGMRDGNISEEELAKAKNQIRGALVLSQENMSSRMIRMAKSMLYFDRVIPLEELISSILKVTHEDVARAANRIFGESGIVVAALGPFNNRRK